MSLAAIKLTSDLAAAIIRKMQEIVRTDDGTSFDNLLLPHHSQYRKIVAKRAHGGTDSSRSIYDKIFLYESKFGDKNLWSDSQSIGTPSVANDWKDDEYLKEALRKDTAPAEKSKEYA